MSEPTRRHFTMPHVFVLLSVVILFCSLLTYWLPSGAYQREKKQFGSLTRTVVIPGTYRTLPKHYSVKAILLGERVEGKASPVSLIQLLSAIPRGMESAADIIFFIFVIGGVFGILQRSGTIIAILHKLLDRFKHSGKFLTIVIMTVIAIGGSTLGMGEEFIPLVPIFLIVSKELGYDRIYGLALVIVAAEVGFAAATTNPFTVSIAQGIAELELGSGWELRVVFFAACLTITLIYMLRYGAKVKGNPAASIMPEDEFLLEAHHHERVPLHVGHLWTLFLGAVIFIFMLYAVQQMGWWLSEMAGGFLLIGIIAMVVNKLSLGEATKAFVKGMEEMIVAAMVVGFAKGIQVVLTDGQILDTLIFSAARLLQNFHNIIAVEGMLAFQTFLNFFIPSGSGQAAVTMPLMAPLSDVLGINRQIAVFAFTCGDGFSNSIIPTSGILMAMLGLAKIPYERWLRFMVPLFLQLMALSALFLVFAVGINYQ